MAEKQGGKKPAGADEIMSPGEMKPILALAKRGNPAACVIALTKDKEGVILLDKRKKPKKLLADMRKQAGILGLELETTTLRFGHAVVDADEDASLLTFTVNKDAPGAMRPKLLERIKKAGFSKIEIVVDVGLENESEEDDQPPSLVTASPPSMEAIAPTARGVSDSETIPPIAPPEFPAPPMGVAPAQDAAALTRALTDLVKRMIPMIKADPPRGSGLMALATQAQASLKAADLASAASAIEDLRRVLERTGRQAAPTASPPTSVNIVALSKARVAWIVTRRKVESDIGKLQKSVAMAFRGHAKAADLEAGFQIRVEQVLNQLDDQLAHRLDEATKSTDPAQHAKLVGEAKKLIQRYEAFIASDPTLTEIDANPFVPLALQKTLTTTLAVLSKTIG
jgi:hypothetical protein